MSAGNDALRALIDEARRAAGVLKMTAHPHESPHAQPLLDAAAKAEALAHAFTPSAVGPEGVTDRVVAWTDGKSAWLGLRGVPPGTHALVLARDLEAALATRASAAPERELVLQERVTLEEAMLRGFRTYRNGCNFSLEIDHGTGIAMLTFGCYALVNLMQHDERLLRDHLQANNERVRVDQLVSRVAILDLMQRHPCTCCGGFRHKPKQPHAATPPDEPPAGGEESRG